MIAYYKTEMKWSLNQLYMPRGSLVSQPNLHKPITTIHWGHLFELQGLFPRNVGPGYSNGKVTWSCTGYNNAKLPEARLWPHLLQPQPRILTKELEVSVVVSESECDVLSAAGVINHLGLSHVGFHHIRTLNRRGVLIWDTKKECEMWGKILSCLLGLLFLQSSLSCEALPGLWPTSRRRNSVYLLADTCREGCGCIAHTPKSLFSLLSSPQTGFKFFPDQNAILGMVWSESEVSIAQTVVEFYLWKRAVNHEGNIWWALHLSGNGEGVKPLHWSLCFGALLFPYNCLFIHSVSQS